MRGIGRIEVARVATAAIAAAVILFGLLVPVYTDEIAWRMNERWWFDGIDQVSAVTCGPGILAVPPIFMWPVRAFSGLAASAWPDPLSVRIAGLACFAAWLMILKGIIRHAAGDNQQLSAPLGLIGVSLMAMGVLPFAMALSRPEYPVLLTVSVAILLALGARQEEGVARGALRLVCVVACGAIAVSYHPKGAIYLPLFLLAVLFPANPRLRWARLAAAGVLIVLLTMGYLYWRDRLTCGADPILTERAARENALTQLFSGTSPSELFRLLLRNANPFPYILNIWPSPQHMSHWLPSGVVTESAATWALATSVAWVAAFLSVPAGLGLALIRNGWRAAGDRRIQFAALLYLLVFGWAITQTNKNSYESALALPAILIALVLALSAVTPRSRTLWALASLMAVGGVSSLIALGATYGSKMAPRISTPGYLSGQPNSTGTFGYAGASRQIELAARRCGIPSTKEAHDIVVDDFTYFSFTSTRNLRYHLGITGEWRGTLTDAAGYLDSVNSSGLIMQCQNVPEGLRRHALVTGSICCMSPRRLRAAAVDPESQMPPFRLPPRR